MANLLPFETFAAAAPGDSPPRGPGGIRPAGRPGAEPSASSPHATCEHCGVAYTLLEFAELEGRGWLGWGKRRLEIRDCRCGQLIGRVLP